MADKLTLGVIVGSLRKGSYSRRVDKALAARAPASWSTRFPEVGELPLYNEDLDSEPPKQWTAFRKAIAACDALLFVTPEYNRSMPGALKNALDVGSRPQGKNVFDGVPAAVVSVSPYAGGGMAGNHALRQSFVYLNLAVMQQPEAYIREADKLVDATGEVTGNGDTQLRTFMTAFEAWCALVGGGRVPEPFEAVMSKREDASNAYIRGDVAPLAAMSSERDPVTFFPPSGARVFGAKAVVAANRAGAKTFANGSSGTFEVLATGAGRDFAYWTGVQHADVKFKGKDGIVKMTLRTTEIFRNEEGAWKLIHRHADMIDDQA